MVFNMVAGNTREGQVLKKLLTKLDTIREQLGDDRVILGLSGGIRFESYVIVGLDPTISLKKRFPGQARE